MQGKVVVITGATSGLGRLAALRLAELGARLVVVGRDRARVERTLAELRAAGPRAAHTGYVGDLSLIAEVKRVGAEVAAAEPRIDVLINNAGAIFGSRQLTAEGLERTFATNHMAYFVLTQALLESLKAAAPARVVNTASDAHFGRRLDFDDLQMTRGYRAQGTYGRSKLANILFTRELARRLAGTGVTANCLHPGFVATNFGQQNSVVFRVGVRVAMLFAGRPERGAATIVYLASDPAVAGVSDDYFYDCRPKQPSADARDDSAARRLWEESERIARIALT